MREIRSLWVLGLIACGGAPEARAEVVSSTPAAFALECKRVVAAEPEAAYARFLEVGRWWDRDHTWSGDPANLAIDARPGGCFCEALPGGGGVEHMRVVYVSPGSLLRMTGALGPLQDQPVSGALTCTFTATEEGCTLQLVYRVSGTVEGGLEAWAGPVDSVLSLQLDRWAASIEGTLEE